MINPLPVAGDFALVVHIDGHDRPTDPMGYTSQYIVEPDRRFRVALGPAASADYYPRLTCVLTPDQFKTIHDLAVNRPQASESPALADSSQAAPVGYQVWVTSNARSWHYVTVSDESPQTIALMHELIKLREPILPVPSEPGP